MIILVVEPIIMKPTQEQYHGMMEILIIQKAMKYIYIVPVKIQEMELYT